MLPLGGVFEDLVTGDSLEAEQRLIAWYWRPLGGRGRVAGLVGLGVGVPRPFSCSCRALIFSCFGASLGHTADARTGAYGESDVSGPASAGNGKVLSPRNALLCGYREAEGMLFSLRLPVYSVGESLVGKSFKHSSCSAPWLRFENELISCTASPITAPGDTTPSSTHWWIVERIPWELIERSWVAINQSREFGMASTWWR